MGFNSSFVVLTYDLNDKRNKARKGGARQPGTKCLPLTKMLDKLSCKKKV